jgi:putative ABC transport system permease protein
VSPLPPPRAERLLGALLPTVCRDEALDELQELYQWHLERSSASAASSWYWRQLPGFVLRIHWSTLVAGPLGPPPPRVQPTHRLRREKMRTFATDVRYAVRAMLRTPAFTAIAVLTLALGIGANTTIFSVVRSVLLRPLPFPEPERIVELIETRKGRDTEASFAHANFWDVRDMNRTLEAVGAISWNSMNLSGGAEPQRLSVASASVGFFQALGVQPFAGRLFLKGEDDPGADARIAILSHAFWTTQFGGDRTVLNRPITLDRESYRVIGILPPGTPWLDAAEVFIPLVRQPGYNRDSWELPVIARLAPGISLATARADLESVGRRIGEAHPEIKDIGIAVQTTEDWVASPNLRRALMVLMASVGFLLLIACVNLANMLLARSTGRVRERALRSALGATRGRVVQLAVVESLVLGAIGAAVGLALAFGALRYLRLFNPGDIPRLAEARIDLWVLFTALGAGLCTSILTGLVPALRAPYTDLVSALREGERSVAGSRRAGHLRRSLVAIEVALSLILLVGAGLLMRSFGNVLGVERGFRTENRVMFDVGFSGAQTEADAARQGQQLIDLLSRIRAMPQVTAAAVVHIRPLRGSGTGLGFGAADRPDATGTEIPWAGWRLVSNNYFKTLGVPLLTGRDFTEQDLIRERPRKVIISKRIADLLWPGENAIGRQLVLWKGQNGGPGEVIGVVGDMRDWGLTDDPTYAVYFPTYGTVLSPAHYVVHSALPMSALIPMIRTALAELDPALPLSGVQSLDDIVGDSVASRRFTMMLLATLAAVALLLAIAGVYGVLSYTVSQRRSEVGVRLALGASRASVLRLVMVQGLAPVAIGIVMGAVGAIVLSRFMASLLFGMTPLDLPTYVGVAALLLGAAALSCYLPARDAMRVDVLQALREE